MPMRTETSKTYDKAQIRRLINNQMSAICSKNTNQIISHYAPGAIIFDVKPTFQKIKNVTELRRAWDACLLCLPATFGTEMRDLGIFVSGDLALAHWFWRFTGLDKDHPTIQTWTRSTVGYQRHQDRWQIMYEHSAVSLAPETSRDVLTLVS